MDGPYLSSTISTNARKSHKALRYTMVGIVKALQREGQETYRNYRSSWSKKGFRVLASFLHRRRSTEVNQTLHDAWLSPGLVRYIYILGALAP